VGGASPRLRVFSTESREKRERVEMKVARKHIITAIENAGHMQVFPKYAIKAFPYAGKDKKIGEFGWTVSVVPTVRVK
jgi:hypothetical protein